MFSLVVECNMPKTTSPSKKSLQPGRCNSFWTPQFQKKGMVVSLWSPIGHQLITQTNPQNDSPVFQKMFWLPVNPRRRQSTPSNAHPNGLHN